MKFNLRNIKKKLNYILKIALKIIILHLPLLFLIIVFVGCSISLNKADSKILSTYSSQQEAIFIYNGLSEEIDNISLHVELKELENNDGSFTLYLDVPHLDRYEEKRISISENLPNNIPVKISNLEVKAFKLDYSHLAIMIISALLSWIYYQKYKQYLLI